MPLSIDTRKLHAFEASLDPRHLEQSKIPAVLVGYGEISAIFRFPEDDTKVFKRLPLFKSARAAGNYESMFRTYCACLERAGIRLPGHDTRIIAVPGRPVCLYIAQRSFPADQLCHRIIHTQDTDQSLAMIQRIIQETNKVWAFNRKPCNPFELALDGQLSNWVMGPSGEDTRPWYIDTSTPLYRIRSMEQQEPELMLKSAPAFLRWIIRLLFLEDVMTRYYDPVLVSVDLAANLFKEQRPDLVGPVLELLNKGLPPGTPTITLKRVQDYYNEDKQIWQLFLGFRKVDRFITTRVLNRRYDFILPGPIRR
ncbi:MAG: DUF6206 family protein [Pseudomonadota bacterium]